MSTMEEVIIKGWGSLRKPDRIVRAKREELDESHHSANNRVGKGENNPTECIMRKKKARRGPVRQALSGHKYWVLGSAKTSHNRGNRIKWGGIPNIEGARNGRKR